MRIVKRPEPKIISDKDIKDEIQALKAKIDKLKGKLKEEDVVIVPYFQDQGTSYYRVYCGSSSTDGPPSNSYIKIEL